MSVRPCLHAFADGLSKKNLFWVRYPSARYRLAAHTRLIAPGKAISHEYLAHSRETGMRPSNARRRRGKNRGNSLVMLFDSLEVVSQVSSIRRREKFPLLASSSFPFFPFLAINLFSFWCPQHSYLAHLVGVLSDQSAHFGSDNPRDNRRVR